MVRFLVRSTLPFFIFSSLVKLGKVKSKVFGKVDLTNPFGKEAIGRGVIHQAVRDPGKVW